LIPLAFFAIANIILTDQVINGTNENATEPYTKAFCYDGFAGTMHFLAGVTELTGGGFFALALLEAEYQAFDGQKFKEAGSRAIDKIKMGDFEGGSQEMEAQVTDYVDRIKSNYPQTIENRWDHLIHDFFGWSRDPDLPTMMKIVSLMGRLFGFRFAFKLAKNKTVGSQTN